MGLFSKKADPIDERSRNLNAKIAALESSIKKLDHEIQAGPETKAAAPVRPAPQKPPQHEPVFEKIEQSPLKNPPEAPATPQHFNEQGVRKYDLLSLFEKIRRQFQAPPAANPKLVNYLASGSIQGLRPLRYEKRIARNRFFALVIILLAVFIGIISYAMQHHHHS